MKISNHTGIDLGSETRGNIIINNSIFSTRLGIYMQDTIENIVTSNNISNNRKGIRLQRGCPFTHIYYNNIVNNQEYGIEVTDYTSRVNATYNWWGDSSGPYHSTENPAGNGDNVTDYVDFEPWLFVPVGNDTTDIDLDGMPDWWELEYGLDPLNGSDANLDPDLDTLTNLHEFLNFSKPNINDTDGDGLGDGFEVIFSKTNASLWDTNGNGIGDGLEFIQSKGYLGWIESLPYDWIGMTITWDNYTILVKTNSSVLEGEFDKEEQKLKIKVSGPNGTLGVTEIDVPKSLCEPEDIEIKLDGELINYTVTEDDTYYYKHIEYTHSIHELTADFNHIGEGPSESTDKEEGFLTNIYLMSLIIALIIILLLSIVVIRHRRKSEDIGVQELPPEKLSILLDKKHAEGKITDETYNDAKSLLEKYRSD